MRAALYIFVIVVMSSCFVGNKVVVSNLHDLASYPENCKVFTLPETRLEVHFTVVRHTIIPGPYKEYAQALLGIHNVPKISQTAWEITHAVVLDDLVPDPDYYFALQFAKHPVDFTCMNELYEQQLILNPVQYSSRQASIVQGTDAPERIHFTDLSVVRNFNGEKSGSAYLSRVPTDLPVIKNTFGEKNVAEKAEEAANFIIKIRKRRFKLLAGQYEVFPEGIALETSVRELNNLEQEYLSLFTGKTYSDTLTRSFYYTPQMADKLERGLLCRFSEEIGFSPPDATVGEPIVLNIQSEDNTRVLKNIQLPYVGSAIGNYALYRIPERARVQVIYGSSVLLENEVSVFQYGAFVPVSLTTP